jgi:integrase
MAKFIPVIRRRSKEQFYPVYIRISTTSAVDYIRTSVVVPDSAADDKGNVKDVKALALCYTQINQYLNRLNNYDTQSWTAAEIKKFLTAGEKENISFTDWARDYIYRMSEKGRDKPAQNYRCAVRSLTNYLQMPKLTFADITSKRLSGWIDSLSETKRAKNMYPNAIKKMFEDGCKEFNDYDRGILKIQNQPFRVVEIPRVDPPEKRTTDAATIRALVSVIPRTSREELAQDIIRLVVCLAGINTVDLYNMEHGCLQGDYLCYNRTKTKAKRRDRSFFRIRVRDEIKPLLEKYRGKDRLFNFSERYYDADCFSQNVNRGMKPLCDLAGTQHITVYWLRHTWATIARNLCGASMEEVAFCLNHASAHRITEIYVEKDFSLVDRVNEKVIKNIFVSLQNERRNN